MWVSGGEFLFVSFRFVVCSTSSSSRARSEEDENLLRVFSALGKPSSPVLMICDARPRINALANQATTSGGCENTMFYPFSILSFGDIGSLRVSC